MSDEIELLKADISNLKKQLSEMSERIEENNEVILTHRLTIESLLVAFKTQVPATEIFADIMNDAMDKLMPFHREKMQVFVDSVSE